VSELNSTKVIDTIYIHNLEDIRTIVKLAKNNKKTIGICGTKHSMGGQSIAQNGYRLDMKNFNNILKLDVKNKLVTVEAGVLWCDLIKYLNTYGLSPMTLQSYSTFSIGGTISVNAHGITNDFAIIESIKELKIVDDNNHILICNRNENYELFSLVVGGYGLFGVIYEITLKVEPNVKLRIHKKDLNTQNFMKFYEKILNDKNVNVKLARINTTNMDDIYLYYFINEKNNDVKIISKLSKKPNELSKLNQFMYKWLLPSITLQKIRFNIEKNTDKPIDVNVGEDDPDNIDRNQLLYESAEPMAKLYNVLIDLNRTHILQEYFIPSINFKKWMLYLKEYFVNRLMQNVSLLNITIRYIKKDNTTFLKYAKEDMYAFVFYYRISKDEEGDDEIKNIHMDLTDKVIKMEGTFYLPYRHHYDLYQLVKCYPKIIKFIEKKNEYDPDNMFTNLWYNNIKKLIENN
jgi:UDP-N-acetylenolpyruvoylglucosamine reductase